MGKAVRVKRELLSWAFGVLIILAQVTISFTYPCLVQAGNNIWTSNGPYTDRLHWINSLAINPKNPDTLYIATDSYGYSGRGVIYGVFKTIDGGISWNIINNDLPINYSFHITDLVIDPKNTDTLYAVFNDSRNGNSGVYKSTNGGDNWSDISNGLPPDSFISTIAIDLQDTNILYLVVVSGVYRSRDGGNNWEKIANTPPSRFGFTSLTVDPKNTNTLYLVGAAEAIYKSIDGGSNWTALSISAMSLVIDPRNTNIIYAGSGGGGAWKTTDGGETWSVISNGLPVGAPVRHLVIDPQNTNIIYAGTDEIIYGEAGKDGNRNGGVYKSIDGGNSWGKNSNGLAPNNRIENLVINPETPNTLYAAIYNYDENGGGVYKSIDGGNSWTAIHDGLPRVKDSIDLLTIDPQNAGVIYASASKGIYKSTDGGRDWATINNGLPDDAIIGSLAIDPQNTDTLYAGVNDSNRKNGKVYKSSNGGSSWSYIVRIGLPSSFSVTALAIDPRDSNTLYAAIYNYSKNMSEIYKSTDGGASWTEINNGLPTSGGGIYPITIAPQNNNTIYAGGYYDPYGHTGDIVVYKSTDGGANWAIIATLLGDNGSVGHIIVDPQDTNIIYASVRFSHNSCAGSGGVVFRSNDGGRNWTNITKGSLPCRTLSITSLTIDPQESKNIYLSHVEYQPLSNNFSTAYKSSDSGSTWTTLTNYGLPSPVRISSLAVDPISPNTLYSATDQGVYSITFTSGNKPPNIPSNPSPADDAGDVPISPTLNWSCSDPDIGDTVTYDIYFGTTELSLVKSGHDTNSYSPGTLDYSTNYYWKIVCKDNYGASSIGPIWYFRTGPIPSNRPPYTPSSPSPADGATGAALNQTLSWAGGDPDEGDQVVYSIFYDASFDFSTSPSYRGFASDNYYHLSDLKPSTTYYWRIEARDNHGDTASGPVWSFTTGSSPNNPPSFPYNPSPADGATDVPVTTSISWRVDDPDAGDTVSYDLYFGTISTPPLVKDGLTEASYRPGTLAYGTKYYWRVVARDNHGAEAGGAVWSFTITAPSIQAPNTPTGLSAIVEGKTVYIQWQANSETDIDHYNIYVGSSPKVYNIEGNPFNIGNVTSLTVPDVPEGGYYLAVSAVNSAGQESSLSEEIKVVVDAKPIITIRSNKSSYSAGDTLILSFGLSNPTSTTQVVDVFLGIIAPGGSIYFFDSSPFQRNLVLANANDPRTFTPATTSLELAPGYDFPLIPFFSITLPMNLTGGAYQAFAALTEPGTTQIGIPKLIGQVSIAPFSINP